MSRVIVLTFNGAVNDAEANNIALLCAVVSAAIVTYDLSKNWARDVFHLKM